MKKEKKQIDFLSLSKLFGILSVVLTITSLLLIIFKGFHYGIDFAGGTEVQVRFEKPVTTSEVRKFIENMGATNASVQEFANTSEFLIRLESIKAPTEKESNTRLNALIKKVTEGLNEQFKDQKAEIRRVDTVGPQVGDELKRKSGLAIFYSLLIILIYIGLRFDFKYASSAVICLFHDTFITLGIFSLVNHDVTVQTLAAVLTIIGYSLNDTIINFDRIRENVTIYRDKNLRWIINTSVNDMLSRTTLTSLTTLMSVAALYFFADGVIQDFAFALGIGILIGTYSSIYVASPLMMVMDKVMKQKA